MIAKIDDKKYAKQDAEVQFQINSNHTLPSLIDAVKEGDDYTADYTFPKAGDYAITIHMSFESEHDAIAKQLKVGG